MGDMVQIIVAAVWFYAPAFVADVAPTIVRTVPILDRPIAPVYLGDHKTWRGVAAGTCSGIITAYMQYLLVEHCAYLRALTIVPHDPLSVMGTGMLLGFGAVLGDAVESYYKRRRGIMPGASWRPWDGVDFLVGATLLVLLQYGVEVRIGGYFVITFALCAWLHTPLCVLAHWCKLKEHPY